MELKDNWFGLDGIDNGLPFLIRGRENLNNFRETKSYKIRIDICWTYNSTDISLMPGEEDLDLMNRVEDLLVQNLEIDLLAILSFVYTGNNQKVWYWYSQNTEKTVERINSVLMKFEELPIKLFSAFDPEWEEYNNILD